MFKLKKNRNVFLLLRDREVHLLPSAQKVSLNVLSQVVRWKSTTYKQAWRHVCRKPALCEDGKIYLHDYNLCLSLWGTCNVPYPLYDLKIATKSRKIVDAIVCSQKHPSATSQKEHLESYRGAFVSLNESNWLRSYDHETGRVLREVYLGDPERLCKFKHCDWETYPTQITLMRIFNRIQTKNPCLNPSRTEGQSIDRTDDTAVIAVFTLFPLEFKAMMLIKNSAFGPKLTKVNVTEGTLIIGRGASKDCEVCIYNFRELMEENIVYNTKLGEVCPEFDNQVVGSYPAGLPINCVIKKFPPLLFIVNCSDYNVKFGLVPLHYIINLPKSTMFRLRRLSDDAVPFNSKFPQSYSTFEKESIHFHYDESNRIIYEKPYEIDIYKYSAETSSVEKVFTFSFENEHEQPPKEVPLKSPPKYRSLRWQNAMSAPQSLVGCAYFSVTRSVMCVDYENELDLIAVLGFCSSDARCEGIINIYDNNTGEIIKSMYANLIIDDLVDYGLLFQLDTIVVMEGVRFPRCKCIVYKLCADGQDITPNIKKECK